MKLSETSDYERLALMTMEYDVEREGNFIDEPVVQLFCRDGQGNRRTVEVEEFYPFFYITETELAQHEDDLFNESMVREIEAREGVVSDDNKHNSALTERDSPPRTTLDDRALAKIYTVEPGDVADLRPFFDETWEADVFFTNRFLIESGIKRGLRVPRGKQRVQYEDVEAADPPSVEPRVVCVDIEVWTGGSFPDPEDANQPVTAVTAYDSYDDEYVVYALHPDKTDIDADHNWPEYELLREGDFNSIDWSVPDGVSNEQVNFEIFEKETYLLGTLNRWIADKDPDLLTGWNSSSNDTGNGFDYPYIINRSQKIGEDTYERLSPTGKSFVTSRGSAVLGGREMFDMLQAYKKTQIHEKPSYALGAIAEDELGYGKEDLESTDDGWLYEPEQFIKYNIRDVQAVIEIEQSKNVLKMYDHIRSITGATYSEIADSNIGIIDLLFLRSAKEKGYALPTSERPDVQHYWGAYVFEPEPGKHKNVVYPDLSSLYPNLFRDMNASPETIIGDEDALKESQYSKEDCHTIYVDPRDEGVKKDTDEPERKELYVLKPDVQESFVREIVRDLIDMKYEYKSDEYADEAYDAVKRIVNSIYGCMGDSVSYGKGFRLFDWRIAEAITLAGRDVIKHTADEFESKVRSMGYPDAKIISGDTDSCVLTLPTASGMDESLDVSHSAADYVDSTYNEFMNDRFNIEDGNMSVEIESYAETAIFMDKKKRYAQWIRWDEGEDVDEMEYKGFELVRSDSSALTTRAQKKVLRLILRNDAPKELVSEYLQEVWNDAIDGSVALEDVSKPSAIRNDLWDYGWSTDTADEDGVETVDGSELEEGDKYTKFYTPQPHIRGARYANEHVEGENLGEGSKPMFFYLSGIDGGGDLPEYYNYTHRSLNAPDDLPAVDEPGMHEIGNPVDAIALEDVRNMPEAANVHWEKLAEKNLRRPIERIVEVMGWDFDDLIKEGSQSNLADYM